MAEFVIADLPFAEIRSRRRNGNVGKIEGSENSPFFERRRDGDAMEIIRSVAPENVDVASEIQYRVGLSANLEELRDFFREEPLSHRSEVELHPSLEHDFASIDDDVFKIRPRGIGRDLGNEIPAFEIMGIAQKGDVRERIEKTTRKTETLARNRQEVEKLVRNGESPQAVEDRERRIRKEARKLPFEIRNLPVGVLDERVKIPVVFTEKSDDEQGSECAESIVELSFQRTILRS